jgi:stress response protein YsnF
MAGKMTTIVSALDDREVAQQALEALRKEGFGEKEVQLLNGSAENVRKALSEDGFEGDEVSGLVEAFEGGKALVVARVEEDRADKADEILQRYEQQGSEAGRSVPVVEEEIEIGKKKGTRGVRVSSTVKEKPVEATVTLREDRVEAERRDADRELTPEEAEAAFKEKTVEVTGSREEAEVEKRARVVGEVEVSKETGEREETVRDTVRKTDVEVEKVGTGSGRK